MHITYIYIYSSLYYNHWLSEKEEILYKFHTEIGFYGIFSLIVQYCLTVNEIDFYFVVWIKESTFFGKTTSDDVTEELLIDKMTAASRFSTSLCLGSE